MATIKLVLSEYEKELYDKIIKLSEKVKSLSTASNETNTLGITYLDIIMERKKLYEDKWKEYVFHYVPFPVEDSIYWKGDYGEAVPEIEIVNL